MSRRAFLQYMALGLAASVINPRLVLGGESQGRTGDDGAVVTGGIVDAVGDTWVDVINENGVQRFLIGSSSTLWKGGESDWKKLTRGGRNCSPD